MSSTLLLHTRVQNHRLLHDDILCHLFFLFVSVFTTFQVTLKDGSTQTAVSGEVVTRWQPDQTSSLHCCQKGWLGTYSLFFVRNCKQFPPALSCDCLECVRACRVHVSRAYSRTGTDKDLLGVHLLTKLIVFPSQILFSLGNATIVMATIDVHLSFWERLTPVYLKLLTSWSCCPFT